MDKNQMIEWEIIARKIKGEASEEEEQIFQAWLAEDDSHRKYYEKAEKAWNEECSEPRKADIERLIERFDWFADRTPRRQAPVRRMNWSLAAAGVAILLAAGGILWLKQKEVPAVQTVAQAQHEAIEPGRPQARIILADGQTVNLTGRDSVTVVQDKSGADIHVGKGMASYKSESPITAEQYNTIEIPRGGEFCLQLSDGTMVWLNSDTRLRYPVAFSGKERAVELQGEAYFEVTKDRAHPFIVRTAGADVRVYGTSFNVNAYPGTVQHTTLATGSVGVARNGREYRLQPGQQARFNPKDEHTEIRNVNAASYCLWHKGMLIFENERLEDIMARLAVWYNVETAFEADRLKDLHFTGDLERYADFSEVLRMIAMTTKVSFKINGRQVTVCPRE